MTGMTAKQSCEISELSEISQGWSSGLKSEPERGHNRGGTAVGDVPEQGLAGRVRIAEAGALFQTFAERH